MPTGFTAHGERDCRSKPCSRGEGAGGAEVGADPRSPGLWETACLCAGTDGWKKMLYLIPKQQ